MNYAAFRQFLFMNPAIRKLALDTINPLQWALDSSTLSEEFRYVSPLADILKPVEEPIHIAHARRLSVVNQKHDKKADMKKMTELATKVANNVNVEETKSDEANNSFE